MSPKLSPTGLVIDATPPTLISVSDTPGASSEAVSMPAHAFPHAARTKAIETAHASLHGRLVEVTPLITTRVLRAPSGSCTPRRVPSKGDHHRALLGERCLPEVLQSTGGEGPGVDVAVVPQRHSVGCTEPVVLRVVRLERLHPPWGTGILGHHHLLELVAGVSRQEQARAGRRGNQVRLRRMHRELVELAEHIGAVVMTTPGARGIFPEDHPLSVGMGFPWGSPVHLQSDVILAVGTQIGETMQFLMPPGWAGPASQKLIHLDADATNIGANRPTDIGLVGDAKAGLAALADALRAGTPPRQPVEAASSYARDYQLLKRGLVDNYGSVDSSPVHPGRLAAELVTFLPEDAIVCVDGGNTGLWAHLSLTFRRPRSLLWTGHFGHLGTGLPYAIGAKLARPDRPVFLFSGDGAFGFNLQELETAARENVKLVAVVNCDSAWGMEVIHMQKVAGTNIGVELGPVRYDQVAKGLGCHGEYVESSSDLRGALERALATDLPAVVHVAVDSEENTNPPGLDDFTSMYAAENT
ncbi:MAG: thiamine pyrophosphate-binding protein [Actinobacteria bacterium ATB1]|nr:thiamine pyrophosphate-binding protein [Actinobacteria bacterium ATB1]